MLNDRIVRIRIVVCTLVLIASSMFLFAFFLIFGTLGLLKPKDRGYFIPRNAPAWTRESDRLYLDWPPDSPDPVIDRDERRDWTTAASLHIDQCRTPEIFKAAQRVTGLEILELMLRQPDGKCDFAGVENLPTLRTLTMNPYHSSNCQLHHCSALSHCPHLEYLGFTGPMQISVVDMQEIAASPTLEMIALSGCRVEPTGISQFRRSSTLKKIYLNGPSATIVHELTLISTLESISFGYDSFGYVPGDATTALVELRTLPHLKSVSMYAAEKDHQVIRETLSGVKVFVQTDPR